MTAVEFDFEPASDPDGLAGLTRRVAALEAAFASLTGQLAEAVDVAEGLAVDPFCFTSGGLEAALEAFAEDGP